MLGAHADRLSARLRRLQEVPQLLLEDLQTLRAGRVRHAEHRTPQVEGVGHVGSDAEEDEEDEIDGVAEYCMFTLVKSSLSGKRK